MKLGSLKAGRDGRLVVVTGDVPLGAGRDEALAAVRLVGLTNDVSLRNLIPGELAKGFGFFQSKPASAFSPVFVTPDALGDWWQGGKLHRRLNVDLNGNVTTALEGFNLGIWAAVPSPDGRRLAIGRNTQTSNVSLLENF